jgi:hypothetical protein
VNVIALATSQNWRKPKTKKWPEKKKKKFKPKFVFQFCDVGCSSQIWL